MLNGSQGLRAGGIAGEDDEGAILGKEVFDRLERIAVDDIERVRAIRRTCVVAQIQIIVLR